MRISDWSSDVCSSDLQLPPLADLNDIPDLEPQLPWDNASEQAPAAAIPLAHLDSENASATSSDTESEATRFADPTTEQPTSGPNPHAACFHSSARPHRKPTASSKSACIKCWRKPGSARVARWKNASTAVRSK